uniref:Uncharacterized protein n=1 Tax=Panagrolaimus sp. JU765 TaxID=591449 RepID=A0AC34RMW9_9BILA
MGETTSNYGPDENSSISTVTASPPSYHSTDLAVYDISTWGYKRHTVPTAEPIVSLKESQDCTCKCEWRDACDGLNLVVFTKHRGLRLVYYIGMFIALIVSGILTWMDFSYFIAQQSATLLTIRQKDNLRFPTITLCPKNADALNISLIEEDISKQLKIGSDLSKNDVMNLIVFAIAGAGFDNFDPFTKKWDENYVAKLSIWFKKWKNSRDYFEFYNFLFEDAGYKCKDLFSECWYAGDELPCCDLFRPSYVMLRGRCLRLREFYQEDPALTGTISLYLKFLPSNLLGKGASQPQTILYVSDGYPDVATFPRFYMNPFEMNQLHFNRRVISMLPTNPSCSNDTKAQGVGTCFVSKWLERKIVQPLNCTLFYLSSKHPHLPICEPEKIVSSYKNVVNLAFDNNTRCLPACFRRDATMQMQITSLSYKFVQNLSDPVYQLEFAYDALQEEMFTEIITTTLPSFIAELSGQSGLVMGITMTTFGDFILWIIFICKKFSLYLWKEIK